MERKELYRIDDPRTLDLNTVLSILKKDKSFPLSIFKGRQDYNYHVSEELSYDPQTGVIEYTYQNCYSDNCACVSHDRYVTKEVSYKKVCQLLDEYLKDREGYLNTLKENKEKMEQAVM